MRKSFEQRLDRHTVDIGREYSRLFHLLYDNEDEMKPESSLWDEINRNFLCVPFRGTALNLDDFDQEYEFKFEETPQNLDLDYLVNFCEYFYNLVIYFPQYSFYIQQISAVIEKIRYTKINNGVYTIFVPQNTVVDHVVQRLPQNASYKTIIYHHASLKNNIDKKKEVLIELASLLEPKRKSLRSLNKTLESNLFWAFNSLNIRHNNLDLEDKTNYHSYLSNMNQEELENAYDGIYQMCLLSFLLLENAEIKIKIDNLKQKIVQQDQDTADCGID